MIDAELEFKVEVEVEVDEDDGEFKLLVLLTRTLELLIEDLDGLLLLLDELELDEFATSALMVKFV